MKKFSYRVLKLFIDQLSEEQLDCDVTLYHAENDEVYPLSGASIVGEDEEQEHRPNDDILDHQHPYLWLEK